jgi:hypothetical protein
MIDVVEALQLLEESAELTSTKGSDFARRPDSLVIRALAERQLHLADLNRFPLPAASKRQALDSRDSPLTLGALIVFRTAHRFVRAGSTSAQAINAAYRAARRYLDILPSSLHDKADQAAMHNAIELRAGRRAG